MESSVSNSKKRLFLPLTSEAYSWFFKGKNIEIRRDNRQFKNILSKNYEIAELRKGYSGPSIWAKIIAINKYPNIDDLFLALNYGRIIPTAKNKEEAHHILRDYIKEEEAIIAIQLELIPIIQG